MLPRLALLALVLPIVTPGCAVRYDHTSHNAISLTATAKRTDRLALDFGSAERLVLANQYGTITITAARDHAPELVATLSIHARDETEAASLLEKFRIEIQRNATTLEQVLRGEPVQVAAAGATFTIVPRIDFAVWVPEGKSVSVHSASGPITAVGPFSACDLDSGYGAVSVADCSGAAKLNSKSGNVRASRVRGNLDAQSGYGKITLDSISGTTVRASTSSGSIEIHDCSATTIELETKYGPIDGSECTGAVAATSSSGKIRMRGLAGSIAAKSGYGPVEVEGKLVGLKASSASGSVSAIVTEVLGDGSGSWELESQYGNVLLAVPASFGCELEATTGYGKIASGFAVTMNAGSPATQRLSGTIGKGGRAVKLATKSGKVTLEKRAP